MRRRGQVRASEAIDIAIKTKVRGVGSFVRFFLLISIGMPVLLGILIFLMSLITTIGAGIKQIYTGAAWEWYQRDPMMAFSYIFTFAVPVIQFSGILALFIYLGRRKAKKLLGKEHIRGTKFVTARELEKKIRKKKQATSLPFGSIHLPKELENRHTFTIGLPGTGKSQMLRKIIQELIQRGEKCVIFDAKGEFFSEFFDPAKDLLFNPLDRRSLKWNIFNEFKTQPDIEALAASLIPPKPGTAESFWIDAARGVFTSILKHLYQQDRRTNADLWKMLTADSKALLESFRRTRGGEVGARFIAQDKNNSRQADAVLATMMQYTRAFEFMVGDEGDFSVGKWLADRRPGCIYITNYEDIEDTLRPILSLFIDLMSRKLLSMPDDLDRRTFFLLDEFGSLQQLPSIVNLLTRGRSKGAAVFIGIQDNGQIEKIYTKQTLETIENSCGNRVTFALTGQTADREARLNIGDVEMSSYLRSMSISSGASFSEKREKELAYLPSEISGLPDLTAIVKLRGYDFTVSKWQWEASTPRNERFVIKEGLELKGGDFDLFEPPAEDEGVEVEVPFTASVD
jgi:type IV secretory pathway TraG/TraD family ATPase VirD4